MMIVIGCFVKIYPNKNLTDLYYPVSKYVKNIKYNFLITLI